MYCTVPVVHFNVRSWQFNLNLVLSLIKQLLVIFVMDLKIIFLTVVLEEKKVIQKKRGSGWRWFDTSRSGTLNE